MKKYSSPYKNKNQSEQIVHLAILNKRGLLSLFIGAGISQGCGLPGWEDLVDRLKLVLKRQYRRVTDDALSNYDTITQTRLLRTLLHNNFNFEVAKALYSNSYRISNTVNQIARCGIDRICTYNFDDILEEAFSTEGLEFNSLVTGDASNSNYNGTIIYHVHGLLTANMPREECENQNIIFDETDFNQIYSGPYDWPNLIQISLLTRSSCLFIGMSMRDPNLRRLLDVYRSLNFTHKHYVILKSPLVGKLGQSRKDAKAIQTAINFEFSTLNLEPIWIGDYEDIAKILRRIRAVNKRRKLI